MFEYIYIYIYIHIKYAGPPASKSRGGPGVAVVLVDDMTDLVRARGTVFFCARISLVPKLLAAIDLSASGPKQH